MALAFATTSGCLEVTSISQPASLDPSSSLSPRASTASSEAPWGAFSDAVTSPLSMEHSARWHGSKPESSATARPDRTGATLWVKSMSSG